MQHILEKSCMQKINYKDMKYNPFNLIGGKQWGLNAECWVLIFVFQHHQTPICRKSVW